MDGSKRPALDLKRLRYFLTLVEHGSFSSAAAALGMAQPSLSENIGKLESELAVKLVVRGARGIQLTQAGAALAREGGGLVRSAETIVDDVRQLGGEARGPVSFGLPPALGALLSVPLVETMRIEHPLVDLRVTEAMSGQILEGVGEGRLQLGCVYDLPDPTRVVLEPLLTERLFLVTAPDNWPGPFGPDGHALKSISPAALHDVPLVLTSFAQGARRTFERLARDMGFRLNVVTEIDSLPHIIETVRRASAYTITTQAGVVRQVEDGHLALVPIDDPPISLQAYLARRRAAPVSRASVVVETTIRTILGEMIARYGLQASLAGRP